MSAFSPNAVRFGLWRTLGVGEMNGEYLRIIAVRCLAVAQECSEARLKQKLQKIAEELLNKATEIDQRLGAEQRLESA
jgi:hypothetical protein